MKRVAGWSRAAVAAAVVGVAAGAFMLHAAAAPAGGNKNYSAWMVPSSVPAGSTTQFKVTVENCGTTNPGGSACSSSNASTQYLSSANVSFPSSFTRLSLVSTSPMQLLWISIYRISTVGACLSSNTGASRAAVGKEGGVA